MHLVSRKRHACAGLAADRLQGFIAAQYGLDIGQSEGLDTSGTDFDALRIIEDAPQHLIPAAEPQYGPAAAYMRCDIDVEPGASQHGKVCNGGLCSRKDREVGVPGGRLARSDADHAS